VLEHIRELWTKGDVAVSEYLLSWMAHLIQRPGVKMTVAPVLKGGQGAGKGIIIQKLADIIGPEHFLGVRNVDSVTGCFQEEKAKTNLLTFLDEATFAGDKRQSSVLKGLLSETRRRWEAKFINPIRIANHSNYIVASNYDQIVYVEEDDRRWFCLEVDSKYAGRQTPESKVYFDRLQAVPAAAFARFLYERDLSNFNPRAAPSTEYQRHQKTINFGSVTQFVELALRRGQFDEGLVLGEEETKLEKTRVYEAYLEFCTDRRISRRVMDAAFWRKLRSLVPGAVEHRAPRSQGRVREMVFPLLAECRVEFQASVNETEWDWGPE
jgi:hypothetical protein